MFFHHNKEKLESFFFAITFFCVTLFFSHNYALAQTTPKLLFNSGFEPGTMVRNYDQKRDEIFGIDISVSAPNDWGKIPGALIAYEVGMADDKIRGRIMKESGTNNNVLSFYAKESLAYKTRIQMSLSKGFAGKEFTYRVRMYIHSDFNLLKNYEKAFGWLTIAEFWNNEPWSDSKYPFRVTAGLRKTTTGLVENFYFGVDAQDFEVDSVGYPTASSGMKQIGVWKKNSTVPVPIGEWFELEYYLKEGNKSTGRFILSMTRQDGQKQTVLDVTNWTHHTQATYTDGFQSIDPLKMYTSNEITDHVRNRGGALQFYWDDFKFFSGDARSGTPPTPPTSSLTHSPSSITQGQSTTLSWNSTNTTSCTGTNFSTNNKTSGSLSLSPTTSTTYTLVCTGPGGDITKNVNVTVAQPSTTRSPYTTKPSLPNDSIFSLHFDKLTQQSQEVSGQNITYFETDLTNTQSIRNPSLTTPFPQVYSITGVSELPPLFKVGSNKQNEWKEYTVDIPQTITVTPKLRVSSKDGVSSNPTFKGTLGDIDFFFAVPNTNDWNNWTTVEALPLTLEQGNNQIIRVTNLSQGADWHRLWFEKSSSSQDLPSLSLKTPPSPVTNNPQSLLEIEANQSGTLSFTGDCTFTPTAIQAGSTFLTLTKEQKKAYTNCQITLTNEQNQQSTPLTIPSFTLSYRADLNKDLKVDIFDFTLLVSNFGRNECTNIADLNNDCKVDIFDFTIFLQEFGRGV